MAEVIWTRLPEHPYQQKLQAGVPCRRVFYRKENSYTIILYVLDTRSDPETLAERIRDSVANSSDAGHEESSHA